MDRHSNSSRFYSGWCSKCNKQQQENPNQAKYPYKVELDQAENMPLIGSHTYVNVLENALKQARLSNKSYVFTETVNLMFESWKQKIKHQEEIYTISLNHIVVNTCTEKESRW